MSSELLSKIDGILAQADLPERHSFFQIEKFIIGKEPTAQGQMWQIIRELRARRETIESFELQLADAGDNLDLIDIQIERQKQIVKGKGNDPNFQSLPPNALNMREAEINIKKLKREKEHLTKSIAKVQVKVQCVLEEARFFLSAFERLLEIENVKAYDDRDAQIEYWNEKLLEEFNLRVLLRSPLDSELVRTIMALNDDAPVKKHVTTMLQQVQKSMIEQNKAVLEKLDRKPEVKPKARIKGG